MDYESINRGSIWRKWDFHVHTKNTNKNDQFSSKNFDDFCVELFKKAIANSISAIGITDYFCIENYKKVLDFRNCILTDKTQTINSQFNSDEKDIINQMFIFPNVELRMLPSTNKAKLINIHCLFNPEYVPHLDNDFFNSLKNEAMFPMNKHGITEYGKSLSKDIGEKEAYIKGLHNFVVDFKSLKKVLSNSNLKNNTIIVVSNSSNDGNSSYNEHYSLLENDQSDLSGLRSSIYKISDAIFSTRQKDIDYFSGQRLKNATEEEIMKEIQTVIFERGSLKPCLAGCDAHTEEALFKERYTWIKSEMSFEGLKQVLYEPIQRVRSYLNPPNTKRLDKVIRSVSFVGHDGFIKKPIYLNPDLNTIIGGKSSGKSLLLYYMANTIDWKYSQHQYYLI